MKASHQDKGIDSVKTDSLRVLPAGVATLLRVHWAYNLATKLKERMELPIPFLLDFREREYIISARAGTKYRSSFLIRRWPDHGGQEVYH